MRRCLGLVFTCAFAALGSGCQDFDAFATGTSGAGGGATTTSTSTTTSGTGGAGGAAGSGGSTGTGGGVVSCVSNDFVSSGAITSVFAQYSDIGTPPMATISGGQVTFSGDSISRGGFIMKDPAALASCYVSAEIPVYGDGVSTYLALYKSGDALERIEIAINPTGAGTQACVSGLIDGMPIGSCVAVPATVDGLRINVTESKLILEALEAGAPVGTPSSTALPSWIATTKIAFGIDGTGGIGTVYASAFESLGASPP